MKQTINFFHFRDAFHNMDRQSNFPDGGLSVLWDYLESYEEDTGEELELDVVALCCDYYQMTFAEVARDYMDESDYADLDEDELKEAVLEYLNENTLVVGEVGTDQVIFQCF